jgi:hypothetical protein
MGFTAGMQEWFNIQKSINVLHHMTNEGLEKGRISSID